ncbi:unnamed protein product [Rhizoctonia solani]|uniref:Uncharacterized protein n=1 Tax=Rhizoctonia solani TaxID=456999 RepID=A0A8H3CXL1_9AGAM|nr:unnamed protein product [Rhizoctonia solani]
MEHLDAKSRKSPRKIPYEQQQQRPRSRRHRQDQWENPRAQLHVPLETLIADGRRLKILTQKDDKEMWKAKRWSPRCQTIQWTKGRVADGSVVARELLGAGSRGGEHKF